MNSDLLGGFLAAGRCGWVVDGPPQIISIQYDHDACCPSPVRPTFIPSPVRPPFLDPSNSAVRTQLLLRVWEATETGNPLVAVVALHLDALFS